jgi:splicing factor U2AF 65 kDa subunit
LQRLHQINAANALGLGTGILPQMANPQALNQATKLMREIYIGNMPPGTTASQLTDFINTTMTKMKLNIPSPFGGPVASVWISTDGHYAFVEMRTVEEASSALNHLGGMSIGGFQLRVGRPKTNSTTQAMTTIGNLPLGVGSLFAAGGTSVRTGGPIEVKDVIMVSNLPYVIDESQVRELLEPFGEVQPPHPTFRFSSLFIALSLSFLLSQIRTFNFIKIESPQAGAAVLEYVDLSATEGAIKGLNGLMVGGFQLSVQRVPPHMAALLLVPATNSASDIDPLLLCPPSCILRLSNMVSEEDLQDDEAYEELKVWLVSHLFSLTFPSSCH